MAFIARNAELSHFRETYLKQNSMSPIGEPRISKPPSILIMSPGKSGSISKEWTYDSGSDVTCLGDSVVATLVCRMISHLEIFKNKPSSGPNCEIIV
jgi:hypothetical protein